MKNYLINYIWGIHVFTAIIEAKSEEEAIAKFKDGTGGTADILKVKEVKNESQSFRKTQMRILPDHQA